jgi:hypothetical protein
MHLIGYVFLGILAGASLVHVYELGLNRGANLLADFIKEEQRKDGERE